MSLVPIEAGITISDGNITVLVSLTSPLMREQGNLAYFKCTTISKYQFQLIFSAFHSIYSSYFIFLFIYIVFVHFLIGLTYCKFFVKFIWKLVDRIRILWSGTILPMILLKVLDYFQHYNGNSPQTVRYFSNINPRSFGYLEVIALNQIVWS